VKGGCGLVLRAGCPAARAPSPGRGASADAAANSRRRGNSDDEPATRHDGDNNKNNHDNKNNKQQPRQPRQQRRHRATQDRRPIYPSRYCSTAPAKPGPCLASVRASSNSDVGAPHRRQTHGRPHPKSPPWEVRVPGAIMNSLSSTSPCKGNVEPKRNMIPPQFLCFGALPGYEPCTPSIPTCCFPLWQLAHTSLQVSQNYVH